MYGEARGTTVPTPTAGQYELTVPVSRRATVGYLAAYAPLAAPTLTGTPQAPTPFNI